MGLLGTAHSVAEIAELRARTKRVRAELEKLIAAEGGEIVSVRSLNSRLILRSPFPTKLIRLNRIGGRPVLLELRVHYPEDSGSWYVHAPADGLVSWAWKSDAGHTELPVPRESGARVCNAVIAFPLWLSFLVYLIPVVSVMLGLAYLGSRR